MSGFVVRIRFGVVCIFLFSCWFFSWFESQRLARKDLEDARARLRGISNLSRPEQLLGTLFERVRRRVRQSGDHPTESAGLIQGFPSNPGLELWGFDRDGKALFPRGKDDARRERAYRRLCGLPESAYRVPGKVDLDLTDLFGGFSWKALIGRPGRVLSLFRQDRRIFAVWNRFRPSKAGGVAGLVMIVKQGRFSESSLIRAACRFSPKAARAVGFADLVRPERMRIPGPLSPASMAALLEEFRRAPGDCFPSGKGRVAFLPCLDQMVLAAWIPNRGFSHLYAPAIVLFPLFLLCWIASGTLGSGRLGVKLILGGLALVSGLIPLLLSAFLWNHFRESRSRNIFESASDRLESSLIGIDRRFPAVFREKERKFGEWMSALNDVFRISPVTPLPETVTKDGMRLRFFPPESGVAALIDRTKEWEQAGEFDTIMLIASGGFLCREYSDTFIELRRLGQIPAKRRMEHLRSLFERQGTSDLALIRSLFFGGLKPPSGDALIAFRFFHHPYLNYMTAWAKGMISLYNSLRGNEQPVETSGAVLQRSILESGGWTVVHESMQSLGSFVGIGNRDLNLKIYSGILLDRAGDAQYAFCIVFQAPTLAAEFLKRIFAGRGRTPGGPEISAVTFSRDSPNFPTPDVHRVFGGIIDRLEPPAIIRTELVHIGGERRLVSVFSCRNLTNYFLVGTLPYRDIEDEIRRAGHRFILLALAMSLVFITLCIRLWKLFIPSLEALLGAIEAMERRDSEHRVEISSDDEFQRIGETFNRALAGFGELAVAKAVQERLLNPEPIASGPWTFEGFTRMSQEVGGDYFDCRLLPGGEIAFVIGDVSGHGVSAALVVAMVKAIFSGLIRRGLSEPQAILRRMNQLLFQTVRQSKMMTCLGGIAFPDGSLKLANAGHCFPYLVEDPDNIEFTRLKPGFPLGMKARMEYEGFEFPMKSGSHLVLFTDGFPEAVNAAGDVLGYQRMKPMIRAAWDRSTRVYTRNLVGTLEDFTRPVPWGDDVTVAILSKS